MYFDTRRDTFSGQKVSTEGIKTEGPIMAKYQLTWMQGITPRWRKKYRGETYYFDGAPSKTLSYKRALAEWTALKEKIDQQQDPLEAERQELLKKLKHVAASATSSEFLQQVSDMIGAALPGAQGPLLQPIIDKFLAEKRSEVETQQISGGRYDNLRRALDHFAAWHGERLCIDGNTIPDYKNHCLKKGARFTQDKLTSLKQFVRFCWEREIIDQLPRTFKAGVKVENGKPKTWDLTTFRALYNKVPKRLQLYLLLQINCGMYSGDISDLQHDEVNWKKGTIHRSRSKTPDNKPTTWKLWPETLKLLKQFRSDDPLRVLVTSTGRPLNVDELGENGKRRRCDSIRQDLLRWCKKNKHPTPPPFKQLRKTGASLIAAKFSDSAAVEYLGQAGRTVAQVHYIKVDLDVALDWLRGEVLGS